MKYFILSICFLCSFSAVAQQSKLNVEKITQKVAELYDLNADQTTKYKTILNNKISALQEMGKKRMTREANLEAKKKIEEEYGDAFEEILNAEQKLLFQKHRRVKNPVNEKTDFIRPDQIKATKAKPKTSHQ